MSKKPDSTYTREDLDKPKVKGLAVHNARKRTEAAESYLYPRGREGGCRLMHPFPPEVFAYCLFGVNPDCTVVPLASGATAADMDLITRKGNLVLLAKKYGLIGFVQARTPKRTKEYDTICVLMADKTPRM